MQYSQIISCFYCTRTTFFHVELNPYSAPIVSFYKRKCARSWNAFASHVPLIFVLTSAHPHSYLYKNIRLFFNVLLLFLRHYAALFQVLAVAWSTEEWSVPTASSCLTSKTAGMPDKYKKTKKRNSWIFIIFHKLTNTKTYSSLCEYISILYNVRKLNWWRSCLATKFSTISLYLPKIF